MTTQEYGQRKQYFLKLHKYFEETDDVNALDCMRERAKKILQSQSSEVKLRNSVLSLVMRSQTS